MRVCRAAPRPSTPAGRIAWRSVGESDEEKGSTVKDLRERVAVVTGGGSGIGEALALACAEAGMDVAVADIERDAASRVAESVRGKGRRALAVHTDVTDRAALETLAERCYDELGACHLLCNNAGVLIVGPLEKRSDEDWRWLIDVNLRGVVHGIQAFLPRMLRQEGERHIVNTASLSGLAPFRGVGAYGSTKYAIVGLSESLRMELEAYGIGVSVVCPGAVATQIFESERNRPEALGSSGAATEEDVAALRASGGQRATILPPERVAQAILDGVRRNHAYVITHPEQRPLVVQRFEALLAAFDHAKAQGLP
jgi:NAD(P)-dependent dehydrogenase (short-subunit alcohol dehydrogenase family)